SAPLSTSTSRPKGATRRKSWIGSGGMTSMPRPRPAVAMAAARVSARPEPKASPPRLATLPGEASLAPSTWHLRQTAKALQRRSWQMGKYVDGFVVPVRKDKLEAYREFSERAGKVWRELGALEYVECVGDDVPPGKLTSFPQAVKLEANETVVFAWIVYSSRAERDRINAAVMKDPRIAGTDPKSVPFDGKRMFWGGFEMLVSL